MWVKLKGGANVSLYMFIYKVYFITVDGGWSNWLDWSVCSVTCGHGVETRYRKCDNPYPRAGGTCPGVSSEERKCHLNPCKSMDANCIAKRLVFCILKTLFKLFLGISIENLIFVVFNLYKMHTCNLEIGENGVNVHHLVVKKELGFVFEIVLFCQVKIPTRSLPQPWIRDSSSPSKSLCLIRRINR